MLSRGFALSAIAGSAMMIFSSAAALAQSLPYEIDERFTGGAPRGKLYSMFGMSPVPRTTVSFSSKERPGTIIINTGERRLYYVLGDGRAIRYGIGVEYDQTLLLSTASSDAPMVKLPTQQKHWILDARYRFAIGKKAQVTLKAGYGRRIFIVDRSGLPDGAKLDMPDVDYRFYDPGVIVRVAVGERAGIHAGGDALLFKQAGYIQRETSYGAAKLTGVEARAGVDFQATRNLIVDVTGSFTQIGYEFVGNGEETYNRDLDPTTVDVGGAADRYIGVVGTVGYTY